MAAFSGKIFQKTAKSKICSILAAVPLALKWRLWYDYDMHHDMMRKREVHSVISYIRGPLEEKREDSVVVEAGNIGYRIFIPSSALGELPGLGEEVKIYTYFSVREDGMSLFGFLSRQDLEMFRQLIGVNGVGPKSALGILSALKPDVLRLAVISGDAKAISKAPGVGAKTAQRIILDLKDKSRRRIICRCRSGGEPENGSLWNGGSWKRGCGSAYGPRLFRVRGADRSKEGCDHRRYDLRGRAEGRVKASGILIG